MTHAHAVVAKNTSTVMDDECGTVMDDECGTVMDDELVYKERYARKYTR